MQHAFGLARRARRKEQLGDRPRIADPRVERGPVDLRRSQRVPIAQPVNRLLVVLLRGQRVRLAAAGADDDVLEPQGKVAAEDARLAQHRGDLPGVMPSARFVWYE